MQGLSKIVVVAAGLLVAASLQAQAPAGAPAGSTGLCKDGSYYSGATKKGACRGHHGVKEWYGAAGSDTAAAAPASAAAPAMPATSAAPAAAPAAAAPAAAATTKGKEHYTPPATAVPGGGPGQVWVNSSSKTYHCPSDKWYGKTKHGEYMTEAAAKAAGNHPDHGKACQ